MKILLTGFDKFGDDLLNPSSLVLNELPHSIQQAEVIKVILPTVFIKSADLLKTTIIEHHPDIVICLGQAGGIAHIAIERIAINLDDARIPDNEQQQPIDRKIQEQGATAYFTTLPIKAIYQALQQHHIPVVISNSAGTFVCNHILYQLMYMIESEFPNIKGGFVHIPYLPEQVVDKPSLPSMSLSLMTQAIQQIIITSINFFGKTDITLNAGQEF